ncbi:hypothetical protein COU75_04450 [Candidatus Peregrinibacteria bacterium CG10_big_fil_rev_8_21_14_0_10_42_8]|nr:MAG: hypothetical protein COU75_04450 [Candidatus Peregrinibacteria bacterium CG10_big_fil_rev_8_21_14_0_10_42_8]
MKKVFANILPDVPYIPLLYPNLGIQERDSILFLNNAFAGMNTKFVELVSSPEDADYILLPHNYSSLKGRERYIKEQAKLAESLHKKLLVFWHGDSDKPLFLPNAIVFRTSQYGYKQQINEVMMPAYAEDLLHGELRVRPKRNEKPVVGFCGWADYKNTKNRIGTTLKNTAVDALRLSGNHNIGARKKGITLRMQAIDQLQKSRDIETNFIIRSSYSGNSKTIKTDVEQTRKEYIHNMIDSDYALVVKGDGNYSYRFYEALSLGRIPVLLDTDCLLPLEDVINYDECVLRVDFKNVAQLGRIIAGHYASLLPEDFVTMQRKARYIFETYLSTKSYLRYITENVL